MIRFIQGAILTALIAFGIGAVMAMPPNYGSAVLIGTDAGSGITSPVSGTTPLPTAAGILDSNAMDPAGRFRVSEPFGLFEDKRTTSIGSTIWEDVASGVGATSTWNANESTVTLTVGTGAGDYLYRQSRYLAYVPGKGQQIKLTFNLGADVANVAKRVGYYDDANGLYFQKSGSIISMCIRTSTSGSPVDTCVPQSQWNIDRMDGSCTSRPVSNCATSANPSGLTLDTTKTQLLIIDFLWQGVGRVRYGFQINGITYYVHQIFNANIDLVPYIGTPSLPVRYEIRNLAASAGATMKQICVSVESEGGYTLPGYEFAATDGITLRAITTRVPILAIRLANTFNGRPNRETVQLLHSTYITTGNAASCELVHVHFPNSTTGGTWVAVDPDSGVEYNTGITGVTGTVQHLVDTNYVPVGVGSGSNSISATLNWINYHGLVNQNAASTNSQLFVIYCTSLSGTANVGAELNWIEFK